MRKTTLHANLIRTVNKLDRVATHTCFVENNAMPRVKASLIGKSGIKIIMIKCGLFSIQKEQNSNNNMEKGQAITEC